jgi:hypothetical protein
MVGGGRVTCRSYELFDSAYGAEYLPGAEWLDSWVRHAAAGGRLPCTKIGGLLRVDPDEIRSLARAEAPARVLPRKR